MKGGFGMNRKYINDVVEEIKNNFTEDYDITTTVSNKNNGVQLTGIMIRDKSNYNKVEPVFYINDYYDDGYESNEAAIMIMQRYDEIKEKGMPAFDVRDITNFAIIKDRIKAKLINLEQNEKYLADKPYMEAAEDLCVCFYVDVNSDGTATVPVTDALAEIWGIDNVEILYECACENRPPITLTPMAEAIVESMSDMDVEILKFQSGNGDMTNEEFRVAMIESQSELIPMYVWRAGSTFGASCMIYPDAIREVQEQVGGAFYVLPSSIHELIVLPYSDEYTVEDLKDMISQVNATELAVSDVLSEHPYIVNDKCEMFVARDDINNLVSMEEAR